MKLSDMTAKLTRSVRNLNGKAARILAVGALAGAALATVPAAQAQRFAVGVQFGGPVYHGGYYAPAPRYVGPVYGGPVYGGPVYGVGYWQHRRYADWRRHEWFAHHYGYYGRPY